MKQTLLIVMTCAAINLFASQQRPSSGGSMDYELYSWQEPNGGWNFSIVPSPSGVNVSAQEVFDKRFVLRGVKDLKRKMSRLPEGARIYWPSRISGADQNAAKEGKKLSYPRSETIQNIRHYAEGRKIKLELSGEHTRP